MSKRQIDLHASSPMFDIVSYGRRGPARTSWLSPEQIQQIERTVGRTPEVLVKVLPKDSNNAKSILKHIDYVGRRGNLEIETDEGSPLQGRGVGKVLLEDWDLDLESHRRESEFAKTRGRVAPKLVHKLTFSMPPGTPSNALLAAVRNFAREEFVLKHRYALVLHTDEPHPHVHMVVKAVSEQGARLNIRKATLREWRVEFARHLREQGVAANATNSVTRGQTRTRKTDGIHRAALRGESSHIRSRTEAVALELLNGGISVESGKFTLLETHGRIERGWRALGEMLRHHDEPGLAARVERFADQLPEPRTDKEQLTAELLERARATRLKDRSPPR